MKVILKHKAMVIIIAIIAILISCAAIYWYYHPKYWRYNDRWIIGRTYDEVVERYGEFDVTYGIIYETRLTGAYFLYQYGGTDITRRYYYVGFDINGVADRISTGGPVGG